MVVIVVTVVVPVAATLLSEDPPPLPARFPTGTALLLKEFLSINADARDTGVCLRFLSSN